MVTEFEFTTLSSVQRGNFIEKTFVHNSCQSMCYDSRNKKYIIGFAEPGNVSALVRMKDLSFKKDAIDLVKRGLPLEHCNDMAYDRDEHRIYVAGGGCWVAITNPDNFQVERKIPLETYAWSIARYPNGDWFIHDGNRGERYNHNFTSHTTISIDDWSTIINALNVPQKENGDYFGAWQGAIIIDNIPYKIFNEFSPKTGHAISFVLFSCEFKEDRIIYRAETNHEIESADFVNGRMKLAYNEPYRYGGAEWEMSEIYTKNFTAEETFDIKANTDISIDLSKYVPGGYQLINAAANVKVKGESIRNLPYFGTDGSCIMRIIKIEKNKIHLRSTKNYSNNILRVTGFCKKK